jgi:hypothetical protein
MRSAASHRITCTLQQYSYESWSLLGSQQTHTHHSDQEHNIELSEEQWPCYLHEAEAWVLVRVLYEPSLNHLVQLLLSALALSDQVAVGTAAGNESLSVCNLILLLLVHLQLVGVLLSAGRHVGVVVAAPVAQLPLLHDHHVSAHPVQEVLAVAHYNQNLQ